MTNQATAGNVKGELESVHQCSKRGYLVNLDETDLRVIATGMISCPNCNRLSPVHIKIVNQEEGGSAD